MDTENIEHRDDAAENVPENGSQPEEKPTTSTNPEQTDNDKPVQKNDTQDKSNQDKPDFNKESLLADLHKERSARKSLKSEVEKLTERVADYDKVVSDRDALQSKYDRLEEFLLQAGGNLAKVLDSRSFTKDLFESDTDIQELVEKWHKNNPSAVGSALSGSSQESSQPTLNDLLRAAR